MLKQTFFMHTVSLLNLQVCQQAMLGPQQHKLSLQSHCKASSCIIHTCIKRQDKVDMRINPIPTKTGNKRVTSGRQFVRLNAYI